MSKRGNPFIEDFVQQSKIHVGIKQFNNTEDRLKAVYEKTLHLLFKGAKKASSESVCHDTMPQITRDKKHLKQLCLAPNGSLCHNEVAPDAKQIKESSCSCGSRSDTQCGYCETPLCGMCQRPCRQCDNMYCGKCYVSGSEGAELCVSCYG